MEKAIEQAIIALSIVFGRDLTPNQDLEDRLDSLARLVKESAADIANLQSTVRAYEHSVNGHKPVTLTPLKSRERYL